MPGPQTDVDVANLALDLCKTKPIASFDVNTTTTSVIAKRSRGQSRRLALEWHTWNFATKRASLNQLGGSPVFGFSNWYELPSNFIRLIGIGEAEIEQDYSIEDGNLLIDEEGSGALLVRYVYDHKIVRKMPPSFIEIWTIHWAIKMAKPLGCSNSLIKELKDMLSDVRLEGEAIDGQQTVIKRINRSRYLNARRGHTTRRADIIGEE